MSDIDNWTEVSSDDFPTEVNIRICEEDGCESPCKKRGRGYARWCEQHLYNHTGDDSRPRSRRSTTTVADVEAIKAAKDKVAKKAENQTKTLLSAAQLTFMGAGDMYCAKAIGQLAEPIAENMGAVASDFKLVASMIDKTDKYFALTLLMLNVTRLGLMIGTHHDVVPYGAPLKLIGIPEPPPKDKPRLRVVQHEPSEQHNTNNSTEREPEFNGYPS